jgi:hypothetical protein
MGPILPSRTAPLLMHSADNRLRNTKVYVVAFPVASAGFPKLERAWLVLEHAPDRALIEAPQLSECSRAEVPLQGIGNSSANFQATRPQRIEETTT